MFKFLSNQRKSFNKTAKAGGMDQMQFCIGLTYQLQGNFGFYVNSGYCSFNFLLITSLLLRIMTSLHHFKYLSPLVAFSYTVEGGALTGSASCLEIWSGHRLGLRSLSFHLRCHHQTLHIINISTCNVTKIAYHMLCADLKQTQCLLRAPVQRH